MSLLVPGFLAGLVFAAIPLLIHLIYRRKAPQVLFAATRFLQAAAMKTARRRRVDNLLLLILRTLLLGLLALGLASPVIKRAAGSGREGSDIVIILDNSLSMSAIDDSAMRFTRAKEYLEAIIARLGASDLVAVIETAPPESAHDAVLTADIAALRARAARLTVSNARGSMAAALSRAAALFGDSTAASRLLYIVTDLQENSLPAAASLDDDLRAALGGVPAIVCDCSTAQLRNFSIERLAVNAGGSTVGAPVEVTATVSSSSSSAETLQVFLEADDSRVASRTVTIPPGSSTEVALSMLVPQAGILDCLVGIDQPDALAADNRVFFALHARDRIKALILKSRNVSPAFDDDSFFLLRALDPFIDDPSGAQSPFDVTVAEYAAAPDLSGFDIVYLLLRHGIPEQLVSALGARLAAARPLVIFPCDLGDPLPDFPWLPARLIGVRSASRSSGGGFLTTTLDISDAALASFAAEPPSLYNSLRVYDYLLADVGSADVRVPIRLDVGDPALIIAARGRPVALFTFAPLRSMSTLPASQFFLPLVYELSYHLLASSAGPADILTGQEVTLCEPGQFPSGLVVTTPDDRRLLVTPSGGLPPVFADTHLPGCYRVSLPDSQSDLFAFCVNIDPVEAVLTRLDPSGLSDRMPSAVVVPVLSVAGLDAALDSLKPVLALSDVLLYAVLALALFECLAANRISERSTKGK